MDDINKLTPCTCFSHDDQRGRLKIEVEMPGVNKKDISLEMRWNRKSPKPHMSVECSGSSP